MPQSDNDKGYGTIITLLGRVLQENKKIHEEVATIRKQVALVRKEATTTEEILLDALELLPEIHENIKDLETTICDSITKEMQGIRGDLSSIHRILNASKSFLMSQLHHSNEFTLFPTFPPELRLRIWKMACFNDPNVVKLDAIPSEGYGGLEKFTCSGYRFPSILHANKESRQEAQNWYKLKFLSYKMYDGESEPEKPKYFNFHADILYLVIDSSWEEAFFDADSWCEAVTKFSTVRKFRRVAVSRTNAYTNDEWERIARYLSKPRSRIEELIIVTNGDDLKETDQQLIAVHGNYPIVVDNDDGGQSLTDVATELEANLEILRSVAKCEEEDEYDGTMGEYADTDTEGMVERTVRRSRRRRHTRSEVASGKKPWPKLTYMALKDVYPIPNARIHAS